MRGRCWIREGWFAGRDLCGPFSDGQLEIFYGCEQVAASEALGQEFFDVDNRILGVEICYVAIPFPAILEQDPVAFVCFHRADENLLQ